MRTVALLALTCCAASAFGDHLLLNRDKARLVSAFQNVRVSFRGHVRRTEAFYRGEMAGDVSLNPAVEEYDATWSRIGSECVTTKRIPIPNRPKSFRIVSSTWNGKQSRQRTAFEVDNKIITQQMFLSSPFYDGADILRDAFQIYGKWPVDAVDEQSFSIVSSSDPSNLVLAGKIEPGLRATAWIDARRSSMVKRLDVLTQDEKQLQRFEALEPQYDNGVWLPKRLKRSLFDLTQGREVLSQEVDNEINYWGFGSARKADFTFPKVAGTLIKKGENGPTVRLTPAGVEEPIAILSSSEIGAKRLALWGFVICGALLALSLVSRIPLKVRRPRD